MKPNKIEEAHIREVLYFLKWFACNQNYKIGKPVYLLPGGAPERNESEDYQGTRNE